PALFGKRVEQCRRECALRRAAGCAAAGAKLRRQCTPVRRVTTREPRACHCERRERECLSLAIVGGQRRGFAEAVRAISEFERNEHVMRRRMRAAGNAEWLEERDVEPRDGELTDLCGMSRHESGRWPVARHYLVDGRRPRAGRLARCEVPCNGETPRAHEESVVPLALAGWRKLHALDHPEQLLVGLAVE